MEANMRKAITNSIFAVFVLLGFLGLIATLPLQAQKGGGKGPKQPPPDPAIAYALSSWLRVMNADGTNKTVVLSKGYSSFPDWSPDGRRLVFTYRPSRSDALGIYLINLDGSGLCKLATLHGFDNNPVWSPTALVDGSEWIIYMDFPSASYYEDLFAVRADCTNPGEPINLTNTPGVIDWYPSWSRFSNQLAVTPCGFGTCDVAIYDVSLDYKDDGTRQLQLSKRFTFRDLGLFEGLNPGPPSWAKNDDRLVLTAFDPSTDLTNLWITDLTLSGTYPLTLNPAPGGLNSPNLSPSGNEILVHGYEVGIYKLTRQLGADGTEIWVSTRLGDGAFPKWRHRDP